MKTPSSLTTKWLSKGIAVGDFWRFNEVSGKRKQRSERDYRACQPYRLVFVTAKLIFVTVKRPPLSPVWPIKRWFYFQKNMLQ